MLLRSPLPDVEVSRRSFHDTMRDIFQSQPERTALVDGVTGRSCTYAELDERIVRSASGLHRLGVAKGDIVAVLCPNCIEYIYAVFAVATNGAIASFINPTYTTYELKHVLNLLKPTWIITKPQFIGKTREALRNVAFQVRGTIVISTDSDGYPASASDGGSSPLVPFETLMEDDGSWYPVDVEIDSSKDVAFILFSSGTTGLPKGVMLSHYNVVATLSIMDYSNKKGPPVHLPGEQAVLLAFLPFFHTTGLIMSVLRGLSANSKVIVLDRFRLQQVLECIKRYKVTVVPLVPSVILLLSKAPSVSQYLSSVRRINVGGAPLSADTLNAFIKVTGCSDIRQGFGLTELTMTGLNSSFLARIIPGSVGVPAPNTQVQVVDPGSGKALGANQRGEVWIKGPQVMLGYWNNPAATKETVDAEGWLHTGDVGYYDDEGHFFIVDRLKELIKYNAFQVAPAELESLILTHPEVADTAVIGVPDKEAGELPKAFVVRKPGSKVTAELIKQFVAGRVSTYKHLRGGVEFVEKIPKSETGKILRRHLREMGQKEQSKL